MSPPSGAVATRPTSKEALNQLEKVVIEGNLATLTPAERIGYYARVCESVGLNPLTRPFEYLTLNNRLILYARKDATDQLRKVNGISIDRLDRDVADDLVTVTAYGHDRTGRTDSAIGAVSIIGLRGEALANAQMKAETKSKRRLTLSLAGLGWLDETEVATVEETPTGTVVTTRAEAVAARAAALPAIDQVETQGVAAEVAAEPAVEPESPPSKNVDLDIDQIPFEPGPAPEGDPYFRRLHAVGAERGLSHDDLHDLAVRKHGVDSLTELTAIQRAQLLAEVEDIPEPPAPVRANETGEADPPGAPAAIDAADGVDSPPAPSAVEQPAGPAGEGGEPVAVAAENGSSTPSVGTPTSLAAFHIYAAAALGIEDPAGYELSELNQIELERVVETLGIEDYPAWFDGCSRELRAVLRNQKMSPKQRADRQANAETEANLAAAGLTSKT